jgi:hypothetical protein
MEFAYSKQISKQGKLRHDAELNASPIIEEVDVFVINLPVESSFHQAFGCNARLSATLWAGLSI